MEPLVLQAVITERNTAAVARRVAIGCGTFCRPAHGGPKNMSKTASIFRDREEQPNRLQTSVDSWL